MTGTEFGQRRPAWRRIEVNRRRSGWDEGLDAEGLEEMGGVESGRTRPESGGLAVSAAVRAPAGAMWECAWGVHPTLGPLACVPGVPGIVSELRPGRGSPRPSVDSLWTDQSHQPNHHKRSSGITLSSTLQVFIKRKTAPARLREEDRLSCMQVQAFGPYRERKSTFRSRPPPTPSATNI